MAVEVVFFYGPPHTGKTSYYLKHFATTHRRISARELFLYQPDTCLREVILKVVQNLKKGFNVVIDDEHWSVTTRNSYVKIIKEKIPSCSFSCYVFNPHPSHGRLQCWWAREWALAKYSLVRMQCKRDHQGDHSYPNCPLESDKKMDRWFNDELGGKMYRNKLTEPDKPTWEEFTNLRQPKATLYCNSPYQLELPALFIEWEALLVEKDDDNKFSIKVKDGLVDAIRLWANANPNGRIIVIRVGRHRCGQSDSEQSSLELDESTATKITNAKMCSCVKDMRYMIGKICTELTAVPIFFTFVNDPTRSGLFTLLPRPGIIAWLQFIHRLNLFHQSSIYVTSSHYHTQCADNAGIKGITIRKLLRNPRQIISIRSNANVPRLPDIVREFEYTSSDYIDLSQYESKAEVILSRDRDIAPFYKCNTSCCHTLHNESSCCLIHEMADYGRLHGVCYKTQNAFDSYIDFYLERASRSIVRKVSRSFIETKALPTSREGYDKKDEILSRNSMRNNKEETPEKIKLKLSDIEKMAASPAHFSRGMQYKDNIESFTAAKNDSNGLMTISCICKGTRDIPYKVSAVIGCSGILSAQCSCPVGLTGTCKHVTAMLLVQLDQQGASESDTTDEEGETEERTIRRSSPTLTRKESSKSRSLPSWLNSTQSTADNDSVDTKGDKEDPCEDIKTQLRFNDSNVDSAAQSFTNSINDSDAVNDFEETQPYDMTTERANGVELTHHTASELIQVKTTPMGLKKKKITKQEAVKRIIYHMSEQELIDTAKEIVNAERMRNGENPSSFRDVHASQNSNDDDFKSDGSRQKETTAQKADFTCNDILDELFSDHVNNQALPTPNESLKRKRGSSTLNDSKVLVQQSFTPNQRGKISETIPKSYIPETIVSNDQLNHQEMWTDSSSETTLAAKSRKRNDVSEDIISYIPETQLSSENDAVVVDNSNQSSFQNSASLNDSKCQVRNNVANNTSTETNHGKVEPVIDLSFLDELI